MRGSTASYQMYSNGEYELSKTHTKSYLQRCNTKLRFQVLVAVIVVQALILIFYTQSRCSHKLEVLQHVESNITCEQERSSYEEIDGKLPHGKHARRRLPHFIIIGVKKCGTRALLNFLNIHPDVVVSSQEVHFFDNDDVYYNGLEWYRKKMPFSYPGQLTGEKSPSYYRVEDAPERIHMMNSSIKLILLVREPIERAMSNYLQHKASQTDFMSFRDAVLLPNGEVNPKSPHIYNSDYGLYIDNWLKFFDKSQIHLVNAQVLVDTPYLVMEDLQEFLGLRPYITEDFFTYNQEKNFYCYYNYSNTLRCLGETKGRPHPPIDTDVHQKLAQYFQPKNLEFFNKIGRSFDWNYTKPQS